MRDLLKLGLTALALLILTGCGGGGGGSSNPPNTFSVYFYDDTLTLLGEFNGLETNSLADLDGNKSAYGVTDWYLGGESSAVTEAVYTITGDTRFYAISNVTEITNQAGLDSVRDGLSGKYILTQDIPLQAGGAGFDTTSGWQPIGNNTALSIRFTGIFSGGGYKITNLWIDSPDSYVGLFGYIQNGASIKDLGVEIASGKSVSGLNYVGGIVGLAYNGSNIANSYVIGDIIGSGNQTGGIAGSVASGGSITNSYAEGTVSGSGNNTGGIAGYVNTGSTATSSISNSYAKVTVSGSGNQVGGIAGYLNGGSIQNSAAVNPSVSGSGYVNRIVGYNSGIGTTLNNFAWDSMPVTNPGTAGSDAGIGKDIGDFTAPTTLYSADASSGGLGWAFGDDDSAPWKIGTSGYPYHYWEN
jgi:hypothetical protein